MMQDNGRNNLLKKKREKWKGHVSVEFRIPIVSIDISHTMLIAFTEDRRIG